MQFGVGQVFWFPPTNRDDEPSSEYPNLRVVTRGRNARGLDVQKGMFFFESTRGPDGSARRPAFLFDSNNIGRLHEENPWLDVIEEDRGYALYHGDNRRAGRPPFGARGNRHFMEIVNQYVDPSLREQAPPILLFEQVAVGSQSKGHRRFVGFGVPTDIRIQTQASSSGHFTNLAIELALLGLEAEDGLFDWGWIDARRDPALTAAKANELAPWSWRQWIRDGDRALSKVRRNLLRSLVRRPAEQREFDDSTQEILAELYRHYSQNPFGFEAIASLVAKRVLGPRCERGWVTKRAGDGGIDFVNRLSIGDGFSAVSLVVLGQAKLRDPISGSVAGDDIARVVARLRRGWLGAFVTTGVFSVSAQEELVSDEYPIVLINGRRVAMELQKETHETGLDLAGVLERESAWYSENLSSLPPEHVATYGRTGKRIWPEVKSVD